MGGWCQRQAFSNRTSCQAFPPGYRQFFPVTKCGLWACPGLLSGPIHIICSQVKPEEAIHEPKAVLGSGCERTDSWDLLSCFLPRACARPTPFHRLLKSQYPESPEVLPSFLLGGAQPREAPPRTWSLGLPAQVALGVGYAALGLALSRAL